MDCITFTSNTPEILTIYFNLLQNSRIFRKQADHIKWHLTKYNS